MMNEEWEEFKRELAGELSQRDGGGLAKIIVAVL